MVSYRPPLFYRHIGKCKVHPARSGITIYRKIKKHTLREHLYSTKQPIVIIHRTSALQPSAFMHRIADD